MERRHFQKAEEIAGIVAAPGKSPSEQKHCGGIRVAGQRINPPAAEAANAALAREGKYVQGSSKDTPQRLSLERGKDSHSRTMWMDEYVKAGGEVNEVCGDRVAAFNPDPVIAQVTDQIFFSRHPELASDSLDFSCETGHLRQEWMDVYVQYGGAVSIVCSSTR